MSKEFRGYRYTICEIAPGSSPDWDMVHSTQIWRDNLEDAQKILKVLEETDVMFTVYRICLEPCYE